MSSIHIITNGHIGDYEMKLIQLVLNLGLAFSLLLSASVFAEDGEYVEEPVEEYSQSDDASDAEPAYEDEADNGNYQEEQYEGEPVEPEYESSESVDE